MSHVFNDLREKYNEEPFISNIVWAAIFEKDVTEMNKGAYFIIPEFRSANGDYQSWGPARWQSRDATSLPRAGDECLVVFDQNREPWIITWWPSDFETP